MVGRGVTVGRPLGLLLTRRSENATVTLCHTGTRDLAAARAADIVVAAAGVAGLITADMVTPGATVLDVGVTAHGAGAGRRRRARGGGGGGRPRTDARRRGPDDAGDAADQRGGGSRTLRPLAPVTPACPQARKPRLPHMPHVTATRAPAGRAPRPPMITKDFSLRGALSYISGWLRGRFCWSGGCACGGGGRSRGRTSGV